MDPHALLPSLTSNKLPSNRVGISSNTKIFHVTDVRSRSTKIHLIDVIYDPPISRFCALSSLMLIM